MRFGGDSHSSGTGWEKHRVAFAYALGPTVQQPPTQGFSVEAIGASTTPPHPMGRAGARPRPPPGFFLPTPGGGVPVVMGFLSTSGRLPWGSVLGPNSCRLRQLSLENGRVCFLTSTPGRTKLQPGTPIGGGGGSDSSRLFSQENFPAFELDPRGGGVSLGRHQTNTGHQKTKLQNCPKKLPLMEKSMF